MRLRLIPLFALLSLGPTAGAQTGPAAAQRVEIRLSSFHFAPETLRLRAGQPVVLHLVNSASGGHNFAAPDFFAAASGVEGPVSEGKVEVRGHQSADVRLVPARGRYRLRCTHTFHTTFGMRGEIIVE